MWTRAHTDTTPPHSPSTCTYAALTFPRDFPATPPEARRGLTRHPRHSRCCDNHERAIGGDIQKLLAVPSHLTLLIYTLTIKAGASLGSHPPQTHPLKLRSSSALLRMRDFCKDSRKALHKALNCTNGISSVYSLTYNGCF